MIPWVIGGVLALAVFAFTRKASAAPQNNSDAPKQLAPLPSPKTAGPTLCEAGVTVGGAAVGMYYGVPPQASLPLSATLSSPICKMGAGVANQVKGDIKHTLNHVSTSAKAVQSGFTQTVDVHVDLAKSITNPSKFIEKSIDVSKKTITIPAKTAVKVATSSFEYAKKANPVTTTKKAWNSTVGKLY